MVLKDFQNNHDAVLLMGVITNLAVAVSIMSAFPWVRNTHHKFVLPDWVSTSCVVDDALNSVFERHHRFIGWLGLLCTWVFVILGDSYDLDRHAWNPDGVRIIHQQDFWFAFGMTVL